MQRFELGLSMINELTPRGRFVSLAASKGHSCSRARLPTVKRYPTAPIRPRFARRPPGQAGGNEDPHPYRPAQKSIIPSSLGGVSPRPAPGKSSRPGRRGGPFSTKWGRACPRAQTRGCRAKPDEWGVESRNASSKALALVVVQDCQLRSSGPHPIRPAGPPSPLRGEGEMSGPFSQLGPIDLIVVAALPPFPLGGRCRAEGAMDEDRRRRSCEPARPRSRDARRAGREKQAEPATGRPGTRFRARRRTTP